MCTVCFILLTTLSFSSRRSCSPCLIGLVLPVSSVSFSPSRRSRPPRLVGLVLPVQSHSSRLVSLALPVSSVSFSPSRRSCTLVGTPAGLPVTIPSRDEDMCVRI
ncbi:uncharacterized protein BJ212DRAFT_994418 [Suillus subaureus]|uniref:Secreted protein n=1 Tax=Suillus subaureus TaxID=48587 RepID=A0A9P7DUE0_9AGAM|nr:uncharacterized protein BJ212DRAFT_994418 [Suillus subaureus]KAG1803079.1 hypothetical protein BJ212DRAFT_994418 [Suillus subaureus]